MPGRGVVTVAAVMTVWLMPQLAGASGTAQGPACMKVKDSRNIWSRVPPKSE